MPRSPKKLSTPTREKLARASKERSVSPTSSPRKSPRKSPTKTPKKEKSPKKETPKKESGVKSPKKSPSSATKTKNYSHPTYEAMIRRAIKEDKTRKGTSYIAIYKYVDANFQVPANYQTHVRNNLKKLVEDGTLEHGATPQRYKLSAKTRLEDRKSTPKKKKEPSSPKKSSRSSKSEDSPKKKKKTSKSEGDSPKKSKKERSSSPKKTPTKRSPKKDQESPSKSTRSAKKETPTKKSPRGGVSKTEKKTPPKTPRGSAKKASPLSSPSRAGESESGDLKWTWQYYDNGFFNYHPTASAVVEGVYQEYLTSPYTTDVRAVQSGQWKYLVDFREMTQQNIEHENHTKRKIRRVQIPASQTVDLKRKYEGDDGNMSD